MEYEDVENGKCTYREYITSQAVKAIIREMKWNMTEEQARQKLTASYGGETIEDTICDWLRNHLA